MMNVQFRLASSRSSAVSGGQSVDVERRPRVAPRVGVFRGGRRLANLLARVDAVPEEVARNEQHAHLRARASARRDSPRRAPTSGKPPSAAEDLGAKERGRGPAHEQPLRPEELALIAHPRRERASGTARPPIRRRRTAQSPRAGSASRSGTMVARQCGYITSSESWYLRNRPRARRGRAVAVRIVAEVLARSRRRGRRGSASYAARPRRCRSLERVVDHDQLEVGERLGEHALDRRADVALAVVGGHERR